MCNEDFSVVPVFLWNVAQYIQIYSDIFEYNLASIAGGRSLAVVVASRATTIEQGRSHPGMGGVIPSWG